MKAAFLMMAAMTCFTCNDAVTKSLTTSIGIGQTMFLRGLVASAILAALALRSGTLFSRDQMRVPVLHLRTVLEIGGTVTFFIGLPHMPLANVSAIYQSLPIVVTLGAALFLAEPVGWRRWSAILVGLGGVVLIIRPGLDGFSVFSFVILASVVFSAARDLVTKRMSSGLSTYAIAFYACLGVTIVGAAMSFGFEDGMKSVSAFQIGEIVLAAAFLITAYLALIAAMRMGEVSFVAPFRYVSLAVAIVLGLAFFDEVPDALTLVGASIVVGSGLYTLMRERVRRGEAVAAESASRPLAPPLNQD